MSSGQNVPSAVLAGADAWHATSPSFASERLEYQEGLMTPMGPRSL